MALDQVKFIGQGAGRGLENRDTGAAGRRTVFAEIEAGKVMMALTETVIDQAMGAGCRKNVAEGGEGFGCQGFWVDLHGGLYACGERRGASAPRTPEDIFRQMKRGGFQRPDGLPKAPGPRSFAWRLTSL